MGENKRRYALLLDLGGVFHILPDKTQSQYLTHKFLHFRGGFKSKAGPRVVFLMKNIPQLDGSVFFCFPMPSAIKYTLNPKIPPFNFDILKKIQTLSNGDAIAVTTTITMGSRNLNRVSIMSDSIKYPYERGVSDLIEAIHTLDSSAGNLYRMCFDSTPVWDQCEFRFYHTNTFLNGWRGIPVLINHARKIFWNISSYWPQLEVEDNIGIIISDLRDITVEGRIPELVSCLAGPQLCPHCGIVSDITKPRERPWVKFKHIERVKVQKERGLFEEKLMNRKPSVSAATKFLRYLPPQK